MRYAHEVMAVAATLEALATEAILAADDLYSKAMSIPSVRIHRSEREAIYAAAVETLELMVEATAWTDELAMLGSSAKVTI